MGLNSAQISKIGKGIAGIVGAAGASEAVARGIQGAFDIGSAFAEPTTGDVLRAAGADAPTKPAETAPADDPTGAERSGMSPVLIVGAIVLAALLLR